MALITLGANAITALPSGVGGKVLQVVKEGIGTKHATTSTTYADVISKAITPISSSSTIYIGFSTRVYMPSAGTEHRIKFLRDSTELEVYQGAWQTGASSTARRELWEYYDGSHNTTSSITYKVQHHSANGNSIEINPNGGSDGIYYLTLMEIA